MSDDEQVSDDLISAPTRPSAPRVVETQAMTRPAGTTLNATLPVVQWTHAGGTMLTPAGLPRYETLDLLGEGGMGAVVRARDNDIGREVAVKRLKADLQHPELSARFVEEVRTVGRLEHPNIVPIHDAGLDAEGYFFVMKHVEGESLAAIIAKLDRGDAQAHQRWPFERRVDVVRKVLEALRYAHAQGVVHRDIKPANILVGPMGEVFLVDWGIAKRTSSEVEAVAASPAATPSSAVQTTVGAVMGTPLYMSPEQARGERVDERSDLYSLCMTLHEFLRLRHPFSDLQNAAQVMQAVLTRSIAHVAWGKHPHQPVVPMDLSWVLKKGLEKDPAKRFQSAGEMIQRLDDRAEGKVPIQCHFTATKRLSYEGLRFMNQHPLLFSAVMVAMLGASVALIASR